MHGNTGMNLHDIVRRYEAGALSTTDVLAELDGHPRLPLSAGQSGLWALYKMDPETHSYNVPVCLACDHVDRDAIEGALRDTVSRHRILSATVRDGDGGPFLVLGAADGFRVDHADISDISPDDVPDHLRKRAHRPFDLAGEPLVRLSVLSRSESETYVLLVVHHLVLDGPSLCLVLDTLLYAYRDRVGGAGPSTPDPGGAEFGEFVEWENGYLGDARAERDRDYWKRELAGTIPLTGLPTEATLSPDAPHVGEVCTRRLSREQADAVVSLAAANEIVPGVFLLAVFTTLLHRYTGQEDIVVGMPMSTRPSGRFELTAGYFINMLPVRTRPAETDEFARFAGRVQETVFEAIDHSSYPFPRIVRDLGRRDDLRSPVFQVAYNYQNFSLTHHLNGLADELRETWPFRVVDGLHQLGEYDFALDVVPGDGFELVWKYHPGAFSAATVARMADHFGTLIDGIAAAGDRTALGRLNLLDPAERRLVLEEWNRTDVDHPEDRTVWDLFAERAAADPGRPAVSCGEQTLTYRELADRGTALAAALRRRGVGAGSSVGVCFERSLDLLVGLLAVVRTGAAYVPLDPDLPAERLSYMIRDSGAELVVCHEAVLDTLCAVETHGAKLYVADRPDDSADEGPDARTAGPGSTAYIMYTSGSTGHPKGVVVPHRALTNFLLSMASTLGVTSGDRMTAVATYSFDVSALELYLPLVAGGQTRICDSATVRDATLLAAEVDAWRPTMVQATPFTWAMLLRVGWRNPGGARLLSCGEALPENLKDQLLARGEVWNLYGPTETTVYSSIRRLTPDEPVTIGTPIANTQLYVLDENLQPLPVGVPGELCISGRGVATGYHGKPDLTAERFVENPFAHGGRMYRTGDLARRLPGGEIVVLGRMDNQVKLRGYRVELGEIEAALDGHADVANCVVVVERGGRSERLTAYLVANGDRQGAIDTTVLRAHLQRTLPAYMVPSAYVVLESFPLSASGKVDRARLVDQAASVDRAPLVDQAPPARPDMPVPVVREPAPNTLRVERGVRKIFGEVLGRADVGRDEGFFEAGGDSFSAIDVVEHINRTFGCRLRPVALFAHSSIAAMTRHVAGLLPADDAPARPAVPSGHRPPGPEAGERPVEPGADGGYLDDSIAMVGMSCRFPGSADHRQFWRNLREGCSGSTVWSPEELRALGVPDDLVSRPGYVPRRSVVDGRADFDPAFFGISPRDAELMDPQGRLLLLHAWKAVEDAGYRPEDVRNTSVFTSTSNNFYQALLPSLMENVSNARILASTEAYTAWLLAQGGSVPTMISSKLGLSGPSMAVNTNCSSALSGIHLACQGLLSREVDQALVGAASLFSTMDLGYVHEPGLNFSSDGQCRAFDDAADGMSGGEGVGVVVLKRAHDALAVGDHVYCLIRGVAVNNDGGDKAGFYAPSARGQADVIRTALDRSGVDPGSIRYVEAHGTGTKLGDPIEVAALTEAYRRYTSRSGYCGIGSVKSNIGHLDAAAGIASLIKLALGLQHGEIPRTLHCDVPNREIDWESSPFFVVDRNIRLDGGAEPPRAGLSSFGVGGTNVHAVLEQAGPRTAPSGDGRPHLVVLSARDGDRLEARARDLLAFLPEYRAAGGDLASMAYTLQVGRRAMVRRIAFVADDLDAVTAQLEAYVDGRLPDAAFEGTARLQDDELVALFARTDQLKDLGAEWLERGEWEKVAALWVSGIDVDWRRGLGATPPGRVSLPTYPFATTRFWPAAGAERDRPATQSAAAVPAPDDVLADAEALLAAAAGADGVDQFLARRQQVIAEMDAILRRLLLARLWSVGLFRAPVRREQLTIAADQQEWLDHSVDVLVAGGELVRDGDLLRPRDGAPDVERAWRAWRDWRAAHGSDPELAAKAAVTDLMVEAMPAILAGESTATSVLFPGGSFELVEVIYRGNVASDYVNRALADSVRAEVDGRGPGVRILEVGAGTGSASRWVFDKLAGVEHAVAEYCYTDISTAFLVEAEKRFPGIPYLTYRIFDAERDPAEQGFAAGGYDIVVANNALHTTKDIVDTVEHTGALLRPGGVLLLNEVADNELWAHLTFGFLDGWFRHTDGRRIPGGPALSSDSWRAVLYGNGFDTVAFPTERAASLGTRIVRARIGPPAPVPMGIEPAGSLDTYVDDALTQCLTDALRLRRDELEVDTPFADFGLDSLTGVNLVRMLNERLGTDLNPGVLFDHPSIGRLSRFVLAEYRDRITEHRRGAAGEAADPTPTPTPTPAPPAPVRVEAPKSAEAAMATPPVPYRPRQREPIAIIGMSGRFPGARDVEEFWRQMLDGRDPVTPVSRWDLSDHPEWCQDGGFLEGIDEFDPLFFGISGAEASYMEPQQRLFLQEAWHALEDAGQAGEPLDRERCGIYVGCADGDYFDLTTSSAYPAQAYWGNMNSMVPSRLAYYLDLHGPAMTVNTACSSSLTALYLACQGLWAGEADLALAGGVAIQCSPRVYVAGSRAGMLAPSGRCRSFDAAADGFVPAEGVGVLVVRRLSDAEADGDHIHGVIRGIGLNQDGTSNGITAPNGNSQEKLLRQIYRDFEIDPESIGLVEAHGTGTKLGDPVEFNALDRAFRAFTSKERFCALGSVKANIGHAGEAAGVAGVIKTLMAMRHGTIPGLLHHRSTNPAIALGRSPFFVDTQAREWTAPHSGRRRAAVTSLGASGTNVHAVIEEAPSRPRRSAPGGPRLIAVSARTPEALREQVRRLASHCRDHRDLDLGDMSYTLLLGRKHFRHRWACVAGDVAEVERRLTTRLSDEGGSDLAPAGTNGTSTRADAFAADYLDGRLPGFAELFGDGHHRPVPLPGYPFERVRYTLPDDTLPDDAAVRGDAVPEDAVRGERFPNRTTLTGAEFYLREHRVRGTATVPGALYLEWVRAAVRRADVASGNAIRLHDVAFLRPLTGSEGARAVWVELHPEGRFEVRSAAAPATGGVESVLHCQGRFLGVDRSAQPALDLPVMLRDFRRTSMDPARFYAEYRERGIDYGPALRGCGAMYEADGAVLVELTLPDVVADTAGDFALHPAMVDSAMQCVGLLAGPDGGGAGLVFSVKRAEVFAPCSPTMWAWVRRSDAGGPDLRGGGRIDIDLADDRGIVCLALRGITGRPTASGPLGSGTPAAVTLLPTWDPAPEAGTEVWPRASASVGVIAATPGARDILAARYPTAHVLDVRPDGSPREIEAAIRATPVLDHLIWVAPEFTKAPSGDRIVGDQSAGTLQVFRTVQGLLAAGYGNRPLGWTLITNRAHAAHGSERVDPSHAGVAGLAGSAAKEYPDWALRVVDVDAYDEPAFSAVLSLPADRDGTLRLRRNDTWFRHRLLPVRAGSPTSSRMREGGTYVIVGGAGGLGAALSEYLIRRYRAQVVWLGRSPRDGHIDAAVAAAAGPDGPVPHYIRTDATDVESLRRAREEIGRRFGPVHGLVHSGLVFVSASLDRMTETELQDVLRSKVETSVRLLDVFGDEPLDVVLFLSSINSYLTAIKQASYAAACTFVDSFAHAVVHRHGCAAKVINLGYCFNNAADGNDRTTLLGTPVPLIQADELMAAIERLCAGPTVQLTLMKLGAAASPRGITVGDGEVLLLPEEPVAGAAALHADRREPGVAFDKLERLRERNRELAALTL